jgi:hypothetical protein
LTHIYTIQHDGRFVKNGQKKTKSPVIRRSIGIQQQAAALQSVQNAPEGLSYLAADGVQMHPVVSLESSGTVLLHVFDKFFGVETGENIELAGQLA